MCANSSYFNVIYIKGQKVQIYIEAKSWIISYDYNIVFWSNASA